MDGATVLATMLSVELHFAQAWSVNGLLRPADAQTAADIARQLAQLSAEYGTAIGRRAGGTLEVRPRTAERKDASL